MSNQDEVELHYLSNPPKEPMDLNIIKDLPEEIPEVKDSNQEIQAEEESLNLNDGKNNFRKCGITAKQLEEIYIKLDLNKRQLISVWAKDYLLPTPTIPYMRLPKNVEGVEGRIDKWVVKTLDTGRYQSFPFIPIEFESIIEDVPQNNKELFSLAMKIIEPIAIPVGLFSSRFEFLNTQDKKAIVYGLDIPSECIEEFINSQIRQNEVENMGSDHNSIALLQKEEIAKVKSIWSSHKIPDNRYRSISLFFYQLREKIALPFITLYSIPSKTYIFLYFRFGEFIDPLFHNSFLEMLSKANVIQKSEDNNYQFKFIYWKVTHNPPNIYSPAVYCQNSNCSNFSFALVDNKTKSSFIKHQDSREKEVLSQLKRQMQQLWADKYEPLVQQQFEIDIVSLPLIPDETPEDRTQRIQRAIFDEFESQAEQEEFGIKKKLYDTHLNAKLKRCGKCKNSFYCSSDCQKNDWDRHKFICY